MAAEKTNETTATTAAPVTTATTAAPPPPPPPLTVPVRESHAQDNDDDVVSTISNEKSEAARQYSSALPTKSRARSSFFGLIKGKSVAESTTGSGSKTQNGNNTNSNNNNATVAGPSGTQPGSGSSEPELVRGQRAVVKTLEERYNSRGYQVVREPGLFSFSSTDMYKTKAKPVEEKWSQYALCVTRHFDKSNHYLKSSLEIKSDYIKQSLAKVIKGYQRVYFMTQVVRLDYPLKCLYHYMDDIVAEKDRRRGEWREHLELLINFCRDEFKNVTREVNSLTPKGLISSEILWTIFKPGEIFLTSMYGKLRALKLTEFHDLHMCASLTGSYTDYDGKKFIKQLATVYLKKSSGVEKITELGAYPLKFHPKMDEIYGTLLARGRKFESFKGKQPADYNGIGIITNSGSTKSGGHGTSTLVKYNIDGRVMVDAETYYRINPGRIAISADPAAPKRNDNSMGEYERTQMEMDLRMRGQSDQEDPTSFAESDDPSTQDTLTDEQCIISTATVCGFAFGEKQWVEFYLDDLSPVAWNKEAFSSLVLSSEQKALIKALVESHTKEQELSENPPLTTTISTGEEIVIFDDFVRGKGRGLISILHGPPGVGKTLTAESVAEYVQRPLYSVSSGELGTTPADVEKSLSTILDVAKVWNAVLLLDEADVFLEQRSSKDVVRNALVSVFLRMLEYYQGILFLTSNRVGTFDEAFQSRMHVAIRYPLLNQSARREVWVNFMRLLNKQQSENGGNNSNGNSNGNNTIVSLSETDLNELSNIELNGRQIKNAIKTAKSLADSEANAQGIAPGSVALEKRHLMVVLRLQKEFEENFGECKKMEKEERLGKTVR